MNVLKMLDACHEVYARRMINPPGVEVTLVKDGFHFMETIPQEQLDAVRETESIATVLMESFRLAYEENGRIG